MSHDLHEWLKTLSDPSESAPDSEDGAWVGLLVQAGRRHQRHVETGLAHGEFVDGLHVTDTQSDAPPIALAADTRPQELSRYVLVPWEVMVDAHPEGGFFVHLSGPSNATLVLPDGECALEAQAWVRVPEVPLKGPLTLRLPDGSQRTLSLALDEG